jgi:hypothetical protein
MALRAHRSLSFMGSFAGSDGPVLNSPLSLARMR